MHYLWMFIVGLVVGALARWIMPGAQTLGWIMTGLLGIAGSYLGGFAGNLVMGGGLDGGFQPAGLILSVIGALVLLFAWQKIKGTGSGS